MNGAPSARSPGERGKLRITVQRGRARHLPSSRELKDWASAALAGAQADARGGRTAGPRQGAAITIRIVDEAEMRALNHQFRGKDYATNVLSFPLALPGVPAGALLGDIVICAPVVAAEAATQHKPVAAHWGHLVIHGVLHLLGHDHEAEDAAAVMEALEVHILASLGFGNPYVLASELGGKWPKDGSPHNGKQ